MKYKGVEYSSALKVNRKIFDELKEWAEKQKDKLPDIIEVSKSDDISWIRKNRTFEEELENSSKPFQYICYSIYGSLEKIVYEAIRIKNEVLEKDFEHKIYIAVPKEKNDTSMIRVFIKHNKDGSINKINTDHLEEKKNVFRSFKIKE